MVVDDPNDGWVVMLHVTGKSVDSQWFDYRPSFSAPVTRIEWELDSMHIVVPREDAEGLVRHGYARWMTTEERQQYSVQ